MRPRLLACSLALCVSVVAPASAVPQPASTAFQLRHLRVKGDSMAYAVWLPPGYGRSRAWPCIVFLHGSGECGTDGLKQTWQGLGPELQAHPERWPFVVVLPQKPRENEEWEEYEDLVFGALEAVQKECRLDPDRVALTGISQGGHGAWMIGARHPGLWSCLVPVCGYGRALTVASRVARLPVWAFQGAKDDVVDPRETQGIVAELARLKKGRGLAEPRLTLYPDLGHGCWAAAYADSALPSWMLEQKRGPAVAVAPR
jgi:predicted peptidase